MRIDTGERPVWALTIETDGARILAAFAIVNPDKLKGIAPRKSEHTCHRARCRPVLSLKPRAAE